MKMKIKGTVEAYWLEIK
ncbi:hypothetical protein [Xanthomonas albilineans]|nr:hypothetical protein [Xanthomonas albilineans]